MAEPMRHDGRALVVERAEAECELARRVLAGELIVVRKGLQQAGAADLVLNATQTGLVAALGRQTADAIAERGYERIHEFVPPADIPRVTEAVYATMAAAGPHILDKLMPALFGISRRYYFESSPNVRFHIPHDLAAPQRKAFDAFALAHGQGKIAPHGPHRDPWLDCPSNGLNIWIAVGPVAHGNGLTVFADSYKQKQRFGPDGEIDPGETLTPPVTFELDPGDMVLFHTDHLHGSEINRLNLTRYVVSFRVCLDKPRFPNGHYHRYLKANWLHSGLRPFAALPAQLQPSYARSLVTRAARKLARNDQRTVTPPAPESFAEDASIALADLPAGQIRAVSANACIARLGPDTFVGLSRRCPHKGGDFSKGFVVDGQVVCPWHNLPFDPATGRSPCASLPPVLRYPVEVLGDRARLTLASPTRRSLHAVPASGGPASKKDAR